MNRPNNVDKSQKDYEFARNWDMRLSPKEITEMERLSATANALQLSSKPLITVIYITKIFLIITYINHK